MSVEMYRVLKAYGGWDHGDLRPYPAGSAAALQGVRAGALARVDMNEEVRRLEAEMVFEGISLADVPQGRRYKKKAKVEEPDDGEVAI